MANIIKIQTNKKNNYKILHTGDIHFGWVFSDFTKINPITSLNLMLEEQLEYFDKIVNIAIENDVKCIIFPGDFYDKVTNISDKLQYEIQQRIYKLIKNDIVTIIISGNHDTPKSNKYKAPISRFDGLHDFINVFAIHENYTQIVIDDEIVIHALPYIIEKEKYNEILKNIKPNNNYKYNILTTHTSLSGVNIKEYENNAYADINEINNTFDYVALGDYHKLTKIANNIYYSGSMYSINFGEKDNKHYVLLYNCLDKTVTPIEYKTKTFKEVYFNLEVDNLDTINCKLEELLNAEDKDLYLKLIFNNITKDQYHLLNFSLINKIKRQYFYVKVEYNFNKKEENIDEEAFKQIEYKNNNLIFYLIDNENYDNTLKEELKQLYLNITAN